MLKSYLAIKIYIIRKLWREKSYQEMQVVLICPCVLICEKKYKLCTCTNVCVKPVQSRKNLWLITYFVFLQLKSLKLWQCRKTRNVFYHHGRETIILIIRGREKVILIHGGSEKVIWAGSRRKIKGTEGRGLWVEEK